MNEFIERNRRLLKFYCVRSTSDRQNALMYYTLQADLLGKQGPGHLLLVQPLVVPLVVKILILVGLGQVLHRIIPVIEESKTLV